MFSQE
jgi:nuclear pore complex protein Nup98-Nup96